MNIVSLDNMTEIQRYYVTMANGDLTKLRQRLDYAVKLVEEYEISIYDYQHEYDTWINKNNSVVVAGCVFNPAKILAEENPTAYIDNFKVYMESAFFTDHYLELYKKNVGDLYVAFMYASATK